MLRKLLTTILFAAATAISAAAAAPVWEHMQAPPAQLVEMVQADSATEITVADGYIYLYISRPTQVKIVSLLGQPIVVETLQPGYHRLRLNTRGIYILRAGSTTRRITL